MIYEGSNEKEAYFSGLFYLDNNSLIEEYSHTTILASKPHQKAYLKKIKKFAFESNEYPNFLKIPNFSENIKIASSGLNSFAIVTNSGKVFAYGPENMNKECLGREDMNSPEIPFFKGIDPVIGICCGPFHTIAYTQENKVYTWG